MKTYYLRPGYAIVRVDSESKEIVQVLNLQKHKRISKLDGNEFYNTIATQVTGWTASDEITFNSTYNEVLSSINNLL